MRTAVTIRHPFSNVAVFARSGSFSTIWRALFGHEGCGTGWIIIHVGDIRTVAALAHELASCHARCIRPSTVQGSFAPDGMLRWEKAVRSSNGTHNGLRAPPRPMVASLVNASARSACSQCTYIILMQVRTNSLKWAWSIYRRSLPNETAHLRSVHTRALSQTLGTALNLGGGGGVRQIDTCAA